MFPLLLLALSGLVALVSHADGTLALVGQAAGEEWYSTRRFFGLEGVCLNEVRSRGAQSTIFEILLQGPGETRTMRTRTFDNFNCKDSCVTADSDNQPASTQFEVLSNGSLIRNGVISDAVRVLDVDLSQVAFVEILSHDSPDGNLTGSCPKSDMNAQREFTRNFMYEIFDTDDFSGGQATVMFQAGECIPFGWFRADIALTDYTSARSLSVINATWFTEYSAENCTGIPTSNFSLPVVAPISLERCRGDFVNVPSPPTKLPLPIPFTLGENIHHPEWYGRQALAIPPTPSACFDLGPPATRRPTVAEEESGASTAVIIGGVIGGVALLGIAGFIMSSMGTKSTSTSDILHFLDNQPREAAIPVAKPPVEDMF